MLPLILCIIFMSLGAISLTLFILEKTRKYSVKAAMIKSVTSLFFIAVSAVSLYTQGHHYLPVFVTMALILGLLGDVWLDFKYVYKDNEQAFTYAGFIMFGLGHVLFIAGLFLEFFEGNNPLYIIIPFVGGLLISVVNLLLEKVMKLNYGKMKPIAFIYGWLLFTMTLTALSLCILHGFTKTTLIMFFVGGLLFTLSDLILSGTYFGQGKERPIDIATNAVTYYAAQFIIAFAVFFI